MPTFILWYRRDLRTQHHPAIEWIYEHKGVCIPIYFISEWDKISPWSTPKRQIFLAESLQNLQETWQKAGGNLQILKAKDTNEIHNHLFELSKLTSASHILTQKLFHHRGNEPKEIHGIPLIYFEDFCRHPFNQIRSNGDKPYQKFTPFFNKWLSTPSRPLAKSIPLDKITSPFFLPERETNLTPSILWPKMPKESSSNLVGGENNAQKIWHKFYHSEKLDSYAQNKNDLHSNSTSHLSAHFHFGTISPHQITSEILKTTNNTNQTIQTLKPFLSEIAWREFYQNILHEFPESLDKEFNPKYRQIRWISNPSHPYFQAWKHGQTGFPLIDAGIRQLTSTGWICNRLRMILASFLCKDLHIDWRLGEQFFMQHLIDGDTASNNGNWQWCASTGTDAVPYFRIMNPWTQSQLHDPNGEFIYSFLPELKNIPSYRLHSPPLNCSLNKNYPAPIVNHNLEKIRTIQLFKTN